MIRKLLVISFLWAAIILIISGLPGDSIPKSQLWSIPQFDKIVHMCLYFPLGLVLAAEFSLSSIAWLKKYTIVLTLSIVAFYGGLIEILQDYLFINRSADWWDFFSDIFGGALGMLLFTHFLRKRFFSKNKS